MSDTLLIHYNINQAQQATWAWCNAAGELTGIITSGSLSKLSEIAGEHSVVVLLHSQCLHINQLQLPTANVQKQLKAVPYAIEEFIADDIDNFHFVISKNKGSDTTAVVGIDKNILSNIIQQFRSANINVEKIIPDALCMAADDNQWCCLNFNNSSYLQTGINNGLLLSHDLLPYALNNKLQQETQQRPEKILLFCEQENASAFAELKNDDAFTNSDDIEVLNIVYNTHPLVVFCGNYKQASALNLLQHAFKAKRKTAGYWQHWRLAASLVAILLILDLGLTSFQHSQLKQSNIETRTSIETIYKKAFPQSRRIVNPRVQMESKLKELKNAAGNSSQGLIFLLAESFGTLDHDKKNITLQSLTFRNNRMDISLESNNLQAVETLNKNLNKNVKIKSKIISSSSEKNKVKGNIRVEGRS